jgi:hypothetical protein
VNMLKKYLCAYAAGLPGAGEFRDRVNRAQQLDGLARDAHEFFGSAA